MNKPVICVILRENNEERIYITAATFLSINSKTHKTTCSTKSDRKKNYMEM